VLRYQYALTLAAYNLADYQKDVEAELAHAVAGTSSSAYETFAKGRARELLDMLKRGDTAAVQRLVRHDQGYPS
jgi:hypothetical protein